MNEPTPTTPAPTRRKRRQAMSDEGRQILQRERQRVAREQAVIGERLAAEARRNEGHQRQVEYRAKPEDAAVQRGIVRRIGAVLASEDVNVRLDVQPASKMMAYTDFQKIVVRYRHHEDIRLLSAVLRGLMYHEGGHCRWSDPFPVLRQAVEDANIAYPTNEDGESVNWTRLQRAWNGLEDQRMETAVTSDSPRKAAYLTPMIMTELTDTPEAAVANWPLLVWRRYLPRKVRAAARRGFVAENGEAIAQAFEAVVDSYVKATDYVTMMLAVIDYAALLDQVQIKYDLNDSGHGHHPTPRRRWGDEDKVEEGRDLTIPISPEMDAEDDDEGDELPFPISMPPVPQGANDDEDEATATDDGDDVPTPGTLKGDEGDDEDEDEGDIPTPAGSDADEDEDDADAEGAADDGDADGDGEDDADEPTPTPGAGNEAGDHSKPSEPLTQDDIDSAIEEAEAERDSDEALDGDVEAFQEALENRVSELNPYTGGISGDAEAANEAEALADEIERSFQAATMDRMPAWVEGQNRGIINVGRYEVARQSPTFDTDFYRDWVEDDQPGYNMAVSLMLDYSSSMSSYTRELGQTAYAVKLACSKLGIPCTVTLWDTEATVLYDATEQADGLPIVNSAGGTDPSYALSDLENQRFDKVNHIVLIMTDGEWQGAWESGRRQRQGQQATLAWHREDRVIIGFGYSKHESSAQRYQRNLEGYGCTEAFGITNLMEIPERLRDILISLA